MFFSPSNECLQMFLLNYLCRHFLLILQNLLDAPLRQTIYFSNFSHADNFFPSHDAPPRGGGGVMVRP